MGKELTNEELEAVLARAQEIDEAARSAEGWSPDVAIAIDAAEEVGLSRQAVERALAERQHFPATRPVVGTLTWARSADDRFYVAEVIEASEDRTRVRFLRGSDHTVSLDEIRPCALIPGARVGVNWPHWGAWTCTLVSYDAELEEVVLSDRWGSTGTFALSEIWLVPPRKAIGSLKARAYAKLVGAGVVGATIGAILTTLLFLG